MTGSRGRLRCVLATVLAVATASPARAEGPSSEGEAYIERGVELRRAGKNADALTLFERAFALDPTPHAGAQVALARQAMGDWAAAESGLREALAFPNDPWIARYHLVLETALATIQAHLGWLDVEANVVHGDLVLDGTSHYALPLASRVRVVARTTEIEVRAPDRVPVRRTIQIEPGGDVHVVVALEVEPASPEPAASASAPTQGAVASSDAPPAKAPSRTVAYLSLGAATVLSAAGIVAWRVRENNVAIYNDDSLCRTGAATRGEQCGARAETANVALGVEVGSFVAAGLSAAVGVWLSWPRPARAAGRTGASCGPSGGWGVACEGRF